MSEIKISYEYIFDVRMREKKKQEIQKIDSDFYAQVIDYLNELKQRLVSPNQTKLETDFEQERLVTQINNIKRLVREIFEIRERKIIKLALNKSKIKNAVIDTGNFLSFEIELMQKLSHTISEYQDKYLFKIMTGNKIYSKPMTKDEKLEAYNKEIRENKEREANLNDNNQEINRNSSNNNSSDDKENNNENNDYINDSNNNNENNQEINSDSSNNNNSDDNKNNKKTYENSGVDNNNNNNTHNKNKEIKIRIRLLKPLPKLIAGANKEIIGPYKAGEMVHMNEKIALKLIEKKRAERVD